MPPTRSWAWRCSSRGSGLTGSASARRCRAATRSSTPPPTGPGGTAPTGARRGLTSRPIAPESAKQPLPADSPKRPVTHQNPAEHEPVRDRPELLTVAAGERIVAADPPSPVQPAHYPFDDEQIGPLRVLGHDELAGTNRCSPPDQATVAVAEGRNH